MPSRAERRRGVELALRATGLAALAVLLWGAVRGRPAEAPGVQVERRPAAALPRWTVAPPAESLAIAFDLVPDPATRAWLAAIRGAGTPIRWTVREPPVVALEAAARVTPGGGAVVRVAAPRGAVVVVTDSVGPLDSATADDGAAFVIPQPVGAVTVRVGRQVATARTHHRPPRGVVVLGDAGWESRFVIRALEEQGWTVDARIALGPDRFTRQGRPLPLDTARHAAVVLLDSVSTDVAGRVVEFVRRGGGVVLGRGPWAAGLGGVMPARFGALVQPSALTFASAEPRAALAYRPLDVLRDDAVVLERRDDRVVVAARRERAGRVIQVGYEETWRWRMLGGDDAPAAHAAWWNGIVAAAAYRGPPPDRWTERPAEGVDPAPYASLVDALGEPATALTEGAGSVPRISVLWLLALATASFLTEWTSRRMRGES